MASRNIGSGGLVERLITLFIGGITGGLGLVAAWFCYQWAVEPLFVEHRHLWVAGVGVLAFFMLRASWLSLTEKKPEKEFEVMGSSRSRDF